MQFTIPHRKFIKSLKPCENPIIAKRLIKGMKSLHDVMLGRKDKILSTNDNEDNNDDKLTYIFLFSVIIMGIGIILYPYITDISAKNIEKIDIINNGKNIKDASHLGWVNIDNTHLIKFISKNRILFEVKKIIYIQLQYQIILLILTNMIIILNGPNLF